MTITPREHDIPDDPQDSAGLGREARAGDSEAFGQLYERLAPAIYAYACPRLEWRTADAEDVVSEVWVRARQRFDDFDPERSFRSWIFGFAVKVVLEYQRRLARMAPDLPGNSSLCGLDLAHVPDGASSVSRRVARNEELKLFVDWVRGLSNYEQEVLLLRGLQGKPHQQIAEVLVRSEDAIRRCWSRLLKRIDQRRDPAPIELIR